MEVPLKLLIVDDDKVDRMLVRRAIKAANVQADITEACDCAAAITALKAETFDCACLDYRLPDGNGLDLVQRIRAEAIACPLIMLTGQGDEQVAVQLMKAGATDYLVKSQISPERLAQTLFSAIRIYQAEQQAELSNRQLQESYGLLILKNQELEQQRQQIQEKNLLLQQNIAEREQMALQQQDFIAHLTHDLRTPLFASDTMLKMFQREIFCPLPEDMHHSISAMIRSNRNLIQIVDALLEVHCYEAGVKKLNFMPCDLWKISIEVIQELLPLAEEKGIALQIEGIDPEKMDIEPRLPTVQGDYLELRRMMTNLLGNSIKFTDSGFVALRFFVVPTADPMTASDGNSGWLVLEIEDTGYGMSEDEQANLFERFRKGRHKQSGSGLGLHLAYRIVQVHRGNIDVHSELEHGSIFTIRLPIQEQLRDSVAQF
jgi:two-component system, sensor histidine kinase and response regulator